MCKYTVYNYECSHKAEDHADSGYCSEFQRTGVHCNRDSPGNRDQVKIRKKNRNGVCESCLHSAQWKAGTNAVQNDLEAARNISEAETQAHNEQMQRAEQRAREESFARALEQEKAQDARIAELERLSAAEYERKLQEQEDADFEFMLRKSREEADSLAQQREMEAIQQAFRDSMEFVQPGRAYQDKITRDWSEDLSDGQTAKWIETETTTWTTSKGKGPAISKPDPLLAASKPPVVAVPLQPSLSSKRNDIPTPPPPPPAPAPKIPTSPFPRKAALKSEKPKPVDYSLPPIGPQNIGRFKVGTRSQPIHPSQEIDEPKPLPASMLPGPSAPFARLGGQIGPSSPAMGQAQGSGIHAPPTPDSRAALRPTSRPRSLAALPETPQVDAQLEALLAKRRKWETEEGTNKPDDGL